VAEDVIPVGAEGSLVPEPGSIEAEPAKPLVPPLSRTERARQSAYRLRFVLVYFLLAVLAGCAIGALIVVLSRSPAAKPAAWSTWRPDGKSESARILEIATHVPKAYRLKSGRPLVIAEASSPSVSITNNGEQIDIPIAQITLLPALDSIDAASSLQISFCGGGKRASCELPLSKATATYLRRETLELALYTFKYANSIQSITFLMPPTNPQTAIFLQRRDVAKQLAQPLARSLSATPPKVGKIPAGELRVINKTTHPNLYHFDVRQVAGGRVVEVLTPVTPGS
jgi:hypothetical protein